MKGVSEVIDKDLLLHFGRYSICQRAVLVIRHQADFISNQFYCDRAE